MSRSEISHGQALVRVIQCSRIGVIALMLHALHLYTGPG